MLKYSLIRSRVRNCYGMETIRCHFHDDVSVIVSIVKFIDVSVVLVVKLMIDVSVACSL